MIKRILFIVLTVSFTTTATVAQKLEVKGLSLEANDPAATQFAVKDFNGQNCALIIVGIAVDGVEFTAGDWVVFEGAGETIRKVDWSKAVTFRHNGYVITNKNVIRDVGISNIFQSLCSLCL